MEFKIVEVDKLVPNPFQPREGFDEESLSELADSLKSRGDIQPIIVRENRGRYQIIAGERRWRAAKLAGIREIPVLVRDTAEEDVLLESLIENLHRLDLTSVERENALYDLWKTGRWRTYEELADVVGKSSDWVQRNILAAEIRKKERVSPTISTSTIYETATLEREERKQVIEKVKREELPVRKVREFATVMKKASPPVKRAMLKAKSRITPPVAKKILELPEERQDEAIRQIESLRLEEDEAISHIEVMKVEAPAPLPEEWEAIRERYEQLQREIAAKLETPEAKERGEQFRNWTGHIAVAGTLESVSCPICKSKQLGWICHGLSVKEALEEAEKKYQESVRAGSK